MTLTAGELTWMRDIADDHMPDTATILRGTATQNAIGEATTAWGTVDASVDCRLDPPGRQTDIRDVGGQIQTVAQWRVSMPQGTDLQAGDHVVSGGDTYEVIQSWADQSWDIQVVGDLRRLS
jgi:hypothetical protein